MDTGWVQIFVLLTSVMCKYRRKFDKFRMCLSIFNPFVSCHTVHKSNAHAHQASKTRNSVKKSECCVGR